MNSMSGAGDEKPPSRETLGTAGWMSPEEAEDRYAYEDGGENFFLGRARTADVPPCLLPAIGYQDKRHVLMFAGPRAGKGASFLIPNMIKWPHSMVVCDLKAGENAMITAARRGNGNERVTNYLGQKVRVLDPFGRTKHKVPQEYVTSYNPLSFFDLQSEHLIGDVQELVEAMNPISPDLKEPMWSQVANSMIEGAIYYVLTMPWMAKEMRAVRQILKLGDEVQGKYYREEHLPKAMERWEGDGGEQSGRARPASMSDKEIVWYIMEEPPPAISQEVPEPVLERMKEIALEIKDYQKDAKKMALGISAQMATALKFLSDPGIERVFASPEEPWSLSELKDPDQKTTLYLVLASSDKDRSAPLAWMRIMSVLVLRALQRAGQKEEDEARAQQRVMMIMEEFGSWGRLESFEKATSTIGGEAGVKMVFVCQFENQLVKHYGKEGADAFFAQAGLHIHFQLGDTSSKGISEAIGDTQVTLISRSRAEAESYQETVTDGQTVTDTTSENTSIQASKTDATSHGESLSDSEGSSKGSGTQQSQSETYNRGWSPLMLVSNITPWLFQNKRTEGKTETGGEGTSTQLTTSEQRTQSISVQKSVSETFGLSRGYGSSHAIAKSKSVAVSQGRTTTTTEQENHQNYRLVQPHELLKLLAEEGQESPLYPGLVLVRIMGKGESPLTLQRVNYWEDPLFVGQYDEHKGLLEEYGFLTYEETEWVNGFRQWASKLALFEVLWEWWNTLPLRSYSFAAPDGIERTAQAKPGAFVKAGDVVGKIGGEVILAPVTGIMEGISGGGGQARYQLNIRTPLPAEFESERKELCFQGAEAALEEENDERQESEKVRAETAQRKYLKDLTRETREASRLKGYLVAGLIAVFGAVIGYPLILVAGQQALAPGWILLTFVVLLSAAGVVCDIWQVVYSFRQEGFDGEGCWWFALGWGRWDIFLLCIAGAIYRGEVVDPFFRGELEVIQKLGPEEVIGFAIAGIIIATLRGIGVSVSLVAALQSRSDDGAIALGSWFGRILEVGFKQAALRKGKYLDSSCKVGTIERREGLLGARQIPEGHEQGVWDQIFAEERKWLEENAEEASLFLAYCRAGHLDPKNDPDGFCETMIEKWLEVLELPTPIELGEARGVKPWRPAQVVGHMRGVA